MINEDTTLQYHQELNTKLWKEKKLDNTVKEKLLEIASEWAKFSKIDPKLIKDILITGGNCNYNYTQQSDIDLHLVLDYTDFSSDKEFVKDYFMSKKTLWAKSNPNISILGYPVEIFAQDIGVKPHKDQGVYSIQNNKWLQEPEFLGLDLSHDNGVEFSSKEFENRINSTISNDRGEDMANAIMSEIYDIRGKGIAESGEFSKGTLIFKDIRNKGLIDKLRDYISTKEDKRLSYDE